MGIKPSSEAGANTGLSDIPMRMAMVLTSPIEPQLLVTELVAHTLLIHRTPDPIVPRDTRGTRPVRPVNPSISKFPSTGISGGSLSQQEIAPPSYKAMAVIQMKKFETIQRSLLTR